MASRLRRPLTRAAARALIALLAVAIVGPGATGTPGAWSPSTAAAPAATLGSVRGPVNAAATSLAPRTPSLVVAANADLAGFDPDLSFVADTAAAAATANAGLQPSIQYEEAERHADDRIAFTPGARVTVGFRPRATDRWPVGGVAPAALPAGRLDGTAIRRQSAAGLTPPAAPAATVDLPSETAPATPAAPASFDGADAVATPGSDAAVSGGGLRREIFGFLPYWQVSSSTLRLDYSKISTIAYFGVGADAAGNLQKKNVDGTTTVGWSGWTSSKMSSVISTAHANQTRVVLTVQSFAWNTSGQTRQKALLGSSTARLNLARQIAAAVRDRGADGVNLDFEPLATTYDAEFTALVRTIRAELDKVHTGYQVTFDTMGSIGNYPIEDATAPGGADAIFIMGYDYRGASSSPVGSIAPVTRSGYDIRDTIAAFTARVAPSKLILGVPYYGRAWSTGTNVVHASNTSSTKTGASTTVVYSTAADYLAQYGRRYEATEHVAWTAYQRENCTSTDGCVTSWRQLYIDDAAALGVKYDLVNSYGLRGAGIWALGYDGTRPELWGAIETKFISDSVPPRVTAASIAATAFSPNGDGVADTIRASLVATGASSWAFTAAPMTGSTVGVPVRTASGSGGSATFVWDARRDSGAGVADGLWRLTLVASDGSGNQVSRSWNVTVDRIAPALAASASARFSPNGDGSADTATVAWTAGERITGSVRVERGATLLRSWTVSSATAGAVTWDGRDSAGRGVADGTYTIRVTGRDAASNWVARSATTVVDRTLGLLRWSRSAFYPQDGDTLVASSTVSFTLSRTSVVSVAIMAGSTVVRTVWTKRTLPAGTYAWTWNGRNAAGAFVARGNYVALVTATNALGASITGRTILADAFRIVPPATAVKAGQVLTLTLTTTEALRANPAVSLVQPGRTAVTRTATSLGSGRYRVSFTIASGAAGTAGIRITGRDSANRVNVSTSAVTIR